jgi:hypothetical protein
MTAEESATTTLAVPEEEAQEKSHKDKKEKKHHKERKEKKEKHEKKHKHKHKHKEGFKKDAAADAEARNGLQEDSAAAAGQPEVDLENETGINCVNSL